MPINMAARVSTSRYSSDDFETASIRSAAPSYVSEAPSYHSTIHYTEAAPAYTPAAPRATPRPATSAGHPPPIFAPAAPRSMTGLPPVPAPPPQPVLNLHSFQIPTLSANASAARHYRRVAERRINQIVEQPLRRPSPAVQDQAIDRTLEASESTSPVRPLEDPYLVGELAAAEARRERLARETRDDILQREDKHWDWLLAEMRGWEERERNWSKFRRQVDQGRRKKVLRIIGGRLR